MPPPRRAPALLPPPPPRRPVGVQRTCGGVRGPAWAGASGAWPGNGSYGGTTTRQRLDRPRELVPNTARKPEVVGSIPRSVHGPATGLVVRLPRPVRKGGVVGGGGHDVRTILTSCRTPSVLTSAPFVEWCAMRLSQRKPDQHRMLWGGGGGLGPQKSVYRKWPKESCPSVKCHFSHNFGEGAGRGGSGRGWGGPGGKDV